ncbi:glucose-1-phosphate cytidylyltransferase [Asticcacaulis benevestitus]|uniref:Glucose-1-phosphate cytidylyltransferase n=1 Tax=Asticcacaulis benevestitus DSM 16100 = ATCC BAA-896 TaxID=1121022 RepID=V4PME9_9CAUL|nr:glucose-1-phosphate cytidylyltransferase [Asticcacaulis benevestitus]ESQ89436.1 glucose-1-phosphate cytidylyltransferase [Asticcacaulis benevestitus DSM 16100 = ATCC BAA-896]
MRAVILAGGLGTRLAEETSVRPKPMVEVGGYPILWHILNIYSQHGINEFVICLGYKGYYIKEYFANYALHQSSICVDIKEKSVSFLGDDKLPPWKIFLVDTGAETMTGGRLKRVRDYLPADEPFCMTYGDGVADIDISKLIDFHNGHGLDATLTAVRPAGRFGATVIEGDRVVQFTEKPAGDNAQINGGFFVLHPRVIDRIAEDETVWEKEPLEGLARDGQLASFEHNGFWQPMDTLRDKQYLDKLWQDDKAPWKVW